MLTQVTRQGSTVYHTYDGMNNRIARTDGSGAVTRYVLDPTGDMSRVLAETDASGNITVYYVYGVGLLSRISSDNSRAYYHYNNRGDTIALTNDQGTITDSYAYHPFGKVVAKQGSTPSPFRFVGRHGVMDDGDNLFFMRARFYDSEVGRFLTEDPLGFEGGDWNVYEYVAGNPIIDIDPGGLVTQRVLNAIHSEQAMTEILYWEQEAYLQEQVANYIESTLDYASFIPIIKYTATPIRFANDLYHRDYEAATMRAIAFAWDFLEAPVKKSGLSKSHKLISTGLLKSLKQSFYYPWKRNYNKRTRLFGR